MDAVYSKYLSIVENTASICDKLFEKYKEEITCFAGCRYCCSPLHLRPIELWAIKRRMKLDGFTPPDMNNSKPCPFMAADDSCGIYRYRPLICRIHGIPIKYMVIEYDIDGNRVIHDPPEIEIYYCDRNFSSRSENDDSFFAEEGNCFDMEALQDELGRLNEEFVKTGEGSVFRNLNDWDRILLSDFFRK